MSQFVQNLSHAYNKSLGITNMPLFISWKGNGQILVKKSTFVYTEAPILLY